MGKRSSVICQRWWCANVGLNIRNLIHLLQIKKLILALVNEGMINKKRLGIAYASRSLFKENYFLHKEQGHPKILDNELSNRKTLCYSKSLVFLRYSIRLLLHYLKFKTVPAFA